MNKRALDGKFYKTYHSEGWENPDLLELCYCNEEEALYIIRQSDNIKDAPICPHCSTSECFKATERHGWDKYHCDRILTKYFDLKVPYCDVFYLKRCTANPEHMYLLNQRITKGFLLDDEFHFRCQFCDSPDLEFQGSFKSPRIYWGNLWAKCFSKYSCNTCGQHTIVIKRSDLVVSANTLYRKLKPIEKEIIGETKVIEGIAPEIERIVTRVFDTRTFEILEKIRNQTRVAFIKEMEQKRKESLKGKEAEEEKTEYKVWYKDSESKGEPINSEQKESIVVKPEKYDLLIIREETRTQVFINGKKSKPPPGKLAYRILSYVLKHKGSGGTAWNIAQHVWNVSEIEKFKDLREMAKAVKLQPRLKQAEMEESVGRTKGEVEKFSKLIRRRIEDSNNKFLKKLTTKLEANEMDEYEFTLIPNYCLIEKI